MIKITISGFPGAGKTTIGARLANHFHTPFMTIGGFRRQMALDMGITIEELNKRGESEPWTDQIADNFQKLLGKINGSFIFEGRLSWYFIPESLKLFFITNKYDAAKRIFNDQRESEGKFKTAEEVVEYNSKRCKSDIKRYNDIYGIKNCYSPKNYDIIIDTTGLNEEQVYKKTIKKIRLWKLKKFLRLI